MLAFMEANDMMPTTSPALIGTIVPAAIIGLIAFLLIRRFSNVARARNTKLSDMQRCVALSRITDEKKLTKVLMTSSHILLASSVIEKVNDPILLRRLARGAPDPEVRITAFEKAFDQLAGDEDLCYQIVSSMGLQHSGAYYRHMGFNPELLLRIAARHPYIIRRFWPKIKSAYHMDDPRCAHADRPTGSSDCTCDCTDYHSHRDIYDYKALQRFPPDAKD